MCLVTRSFAMAFAFDFAMQVRDGESELVYACNCMYIVELFWQIAMYMQYIVHLRTLVANVFLDVY